MEHVPPDGRPGPRRSSTPPTPASGTTRKPMATWDRLKFLVLGTRPVRLLRLERRSPPTRSCRSPTRWNARSGPSGGCWHSSGSRRSARSTTCSPSARRGGTASGARRSSAASGAGPRARDWTRFRVAASSRSSWRSSSSTWSWPTSSTSRPPPRWPRPPARLFTLLPFLLQRRRSSYVAVGQFAASSGSCPGAASTSTCPEDIETRFTDVWGQDAVLHRVQGEHRLPRGPRVHREEGRLRPRRHPAVGPAGHGQDADGRGGGRRDGQALRLRRPRRLHQHVHGRRRPQGEGRCSGSSASWRCATAA